MKKSLGRFLLILSLCLNAYASEYVWSAYASKKEVYVNETVYLKYTCEFSDSGELYIIDFEPRSSDLYDVVLLSKDETLKDGKRTNSYEYILKVKALQGFEVLAEATMKKTSLESIIDNTTNHYDDTKFDSIHKETIVKMNKISFEVLDTPKKLLGTFELQVKYDESTIKAYEPYHLDVEISGEGNFDALQAMAFDVKNVKVFAQKPMKDIRLDKEGYKGTWSQKFAFVAQEDFTIPVRNIEYFDTKSQEIKNLHIDAIDVKVKKAYKKSELLDEVEEGLSLGFLLEYIYFLFIFVAGFLLGKVKLVVKSVNNKEKEFISKIKKAKSLNQLSILLLMRDDRRFTSILSLIDSNEVKSLTQAKKIIIELVR